MHQPVIIPLARSAGLRGLRSAVHRIIDSCNQLLSSASRVTAVTLMAAFIGERPARGKTMKICFLTYIVIAGVRQCAGINRHMVGDERALQERNSEIILASSFALVIVR